MKRLVVSIFLLLSVVSLGACVNQLDKDAQKARDEVLNYVNDVGKRLREKESSSTYKGDLTEKDVKKVYYSGEDFNAYIFVIEEQLYHDPELKEKAHKYTGHYIYENDDSHVISEMKFEELIRNERIPLEKIYDVD
ncbi:hypothetical protein [Enterococcus gallinarum]|uniref:hypothetical protein n=1 Tax=Enterococcus gallinarum TaxID=1353 RepID=UPI0018A9BBE3|nr:hypothetical protein [Enterococcus gallinarum]